MSRRLALTVIVNLLILASAYCLILLVNRPDEENDETTKLRFTFLLGVHGLVFIWMIVILKIQQLFDIILSIFICLLIAVVALYFCEIDVQQIKFSKSYRPDQYAQNLEKLELTYLNIYFLVYMYCLIGLIPSGIFLIGTQGLMCWQQHLINKYKDRCLKKILYKQSLKHEVCSICLAEFAESAEDSLLQINNCGHIYHEKCLYQWLRYQTKCPMDRTEIFAFDGDDDW